MKTFKAWMEEGCTTTSFKNTKPLLFADGNSLSVQASGLHYCTPRTDMPSYEDYTTFEIGFPTRHYDILESYKDGPGDQTETVFGWVPAHVIEDVIAESGGIVGHKEFE